MPPVRHALTFAAFVWLTACTAVPERPAAPAAITHSLPSGDAAASISRLRAANGLGPVKTDAALTRAAQVQANAMAASRSLSHSVAGDFGDRMRATGLNATASAENLGMGYTSLPAAIEGWVNSPGHNRNLMMADATRIGLASAATPGPQPTLYWALILAGPERTRAPRMSVEPREARVPLPFGLGTLFGR